MNDLRKLFHFVLPYWPRLALAGTALIMASLTGLAMPWALRILVDSVFIARDYALLNRIGLGLAALLILQQGLLTFAHIYLMTITGHRLVADLRLALQEKLLTLPLGIFEERPLGELVSRLTNDVSLLQNALTETPLTALQQLVMLAGGLAFMVLLNWRLTLLVVGLAPLLALPAWYFGRRLQRMSVTVQDNLARAVAVLEEALAGIRVVKLFTQEAYERERFRDRVEQTYQTAVRRTRVRAIFIPVINVLGYGALILILWLGGRQVLAGEVTPGALVSFLFTAVLVVGPLGTFAGLYSQIREAQGSAKRVFEILELAPEPFFVAGAALLPKVTGEVRFRKVSFGYTPETRVLEEIDLIVPAAQVIAVVGTSGVGKTTLVNLLPRFFDPSEGSIELDGCDIRQADLRSLRSQIGMVPQETFLFGGTIRDNIAYGRVRQGQEETVTEEELTSAARAAYADEFIEKLPQGYDTLIGERGVKLSAGQRQRIAIARLLIKDPRILILDEATSALDTESERYVQAALEKLMRGRTAFVIAHRLSTVRRADRILVLEGGRIVEDGRHEDLISLGGIYKRLWELQSTLAVET